MVAPPERASSRASGRAGAELSRIALCTDASALLSPAAAAELEVEVVPIPVALGGEPFAGSADDFYDRMRAGAVATTSQPSPGEFLDAYERLASRDAGSVLSLHLDRRVSGVSESAALAAREATLPIRVLSLPTVSYGVGLCVRAARAALRGGASVMRAGAEAERIATSLDNVFVARGAPGGRVQGADGWALLRFAAGGAEPLSVHETLDEAAQALTQRILGGRPGLVAVGYAAVELEAVADRLAHDLVGASVAVVERYRVAPSVGAHTGPDSFGAFWWPAA